MKCLGKCEGECLEWFIGNGDRGMPIYRLAEDLSPTHTAEECYRACDLLEGIGLIKNIGTASKIFKLSAPAMGDVAKRFFSTGGSESEELKGLRLALLEIRVEQKAAAEAAAQVTSKGGVVTEAQMNAAIEDRDAQRAKDKK